MAEYKEIDSVAVIELKNPPANALSKALVTGLNNGVKRAIDNPRIKSIVLIGNGQHFSAGADITEFPRVADVTSKQGVSLLTVGDVIESCNKPVVSAIHGVCFGGGLEIALFSHYRLAVQSAKLGFPEVSLGILPGANGTQRLPRVVGFEVAMDMIVSGKPVSAPQALQYGILDKIVDGDLLTAAVQFAKTLNTVPHDRRLKNVPVPNSENANKHFEEKLAKIKQKQRGYIAPINCLKAVKASVDLPYSEGVTKEFQLFMELMSSAQARGQQYSFFSERAATKWYLSASKNYKVSKDIPVKTAGVIGAGTMGSGIAVSLLTSGIPVILVEQDSKNLERGIELIKSILQGGVKLKRMTQSQMNQILQILQPTTKIEDLQSVDLIIEAVFENLKLKQELFSKLDKICKRDTVLCSNTSTLDIDKIAKSTSRPEKVVGTHFFAPAHIMPLLENVYGNHTSAETIATVMKLSKKIRKIPVLVKTCHGFVANRTFFEYSQELRFVVEEGLLPNEVDDILEDFGMPMGVFKVNDLSGIDVGWRIRQEQAIANGFNLTTNTRYINGERYCAIADKIFQAGRYGRKTGKGWYQYDKPGGRVAMVDPNVNNIILNHCKELGLTRRKISTQEVIERCMFAAINEGFRCLEDGIASKPEEIDTIWLHGFGFPRYRGGPMFYASQVGLRKVYERIKYYQKHFPETSHWIASEMLQRIAESGRNVPISEWTKFNPTPTSSRL
ncbi:hypothetical protein LOTGIDRAFT_202473 [Lottia gigantea]|uniref:Peroxisomal bifunctional enzyme n=1 Tax=Lottia gigantea TaxID=225164 RepID=V4BZQ5_LOTGI|nr:hypothetical protein LOTGIDRAFT_202473 [Lottia gigantea]ESO94639.1 hypothetical protein LOTGIDRAFT_202473 [Lottia gigantea]